MSSVLRSYKNVQPTTVYNNGQVGDIKMSAAIIDHGGWLLCNGRAVDVREYYMLFKMIGYSFGSAESGNKFLLPAPQGRVPGFTGQGPSGEPWSMGDVSGSYTHTLTVPEMPSHNHGYQGLNNANDFTDISGQHVHGITDPGHTHTYSDTPNNQNCDNAFNTETAADQFRVTANTGSSFTGISVNANGEHRHIIYPRGGGQPHNNIQPTLFVGNMFIYTGVNKYYAENAYP
jgi:microcystin-dependent protein